MATSKDKYYTEICNTLTGYNDRNNMSLSNMNILEAIRKFMEEESIMDANNVTGDTISHASSAYRGNTNTIFTSEKIDKSDKIVDSVKNLTINNAKYYKSHTATASDAQGDITCNPETVTHTRNGNFEQKLLSYRTIPVLSPPINPEVDQGIVEIKFTPPMILMPVTNEIIADAVLGGVWVSRTPW